MTKELVWDFDSSKYNIGCAAEKRDILVTHPSGIEEVFKSREKFWGDWRKKEGGWLGEYNAGRETPLHYTEFTIVDRQHPEPIEYALSSVKHHIYNVCDKLGVSTYYGYIGRGDSFRVELSTLLKYKGNRTNYIKPVHLPAIEEYLIKKHDAQIVTGLEADDKVIMDCYKNPNRIIVGEDKDSNGVNNLKLYNPYTGKFTDTTSTLGKLYKDSKGKVRGFGRKFFYFQMLSGDSVDNYKANCFSDLKWADGSAYNVLVDCKSDRECLQKLMDSFKVLYPEKKVVTGWRGNDIEIDAFYVANEMWNMARMLRWEGDNVTLKEALDKLEVSYGR